MLLGPKELFILIYFLFFLVTSIERKTGERRHIHNGGGGRTVDVEWFSSPPLHATHCRTSASTLSLRFLDHRKWFQYIYNNVTLSDS
jgi:hypothetical protein